MKFDDASWHYGGQGFPADSPDSYGGTHIGLFLRWCFVRGWASEAHLDWDPQSVASVFDGHPSGTEFLMRFCDGKFTDGSLSAHGIAFAARYYGDNGMYLQDYGDNFGPLMYSVPESKHDFEVFSEIIRSRIASNIVTSDD